MGDLEQKNRSITSLSGFRDGVLRTVFPGLLMLGFIAFGSDAYAVDFSEWDGLLKKHVRPATIDGVKLNAVSYARLKNDAQFSQLVTSLKNVDLGKLESREEKLSFWINVYNILAVKMIVDHYPVESIRDIGSFFRPVWKRPAGVVAGQMRTLHEIEHEILRKMDEPRIHAAIVCASVSCPDLKTEAFTAGRLSEQLDEQMKTFLANPEKGMRLDSKNNRLHLSSIFKWFEEDFKTRGGVLAFIAPYSPPAVQAKFKDNELKVSHLKYNWGVNGS